MSVLERVKSLKQNMTATLTSMKERSQAFERKVDVILTKVEENERMLEMKFPWLQTVMSNVDVPSVQSIQHVTSGPARLPIDPHLKAIPDMNSSPIRGPIDSHSIPINHMNSNPRIVLVGAPWNPKSSPSCDNSSSNPKTVPICPHWYPKSNSRCDMNSFGLLSCLHIPHTMMATTSLAGCVACEYESNVNEQLFSIEDIDDSDLHSGNIPELAYLKSLSRPIMSPHQSCMRSLSSKYVLCIPIKRRKRFKIPNVSNRNDQYHSIHQYHHHDATPAFDSRLYDRGRSYNKGQSYERGWNCIPQDLFCICLINSFNTLAHML